MPDCLFVLLENIPEDTMICTSGRIAIVCFGNMFDELTWEVDAVASATVTSDAIKAAVKDCIEQAKSK